MTEITLTCTQWNDIHADFKTHTGDDQLAYTWDEETNSMELVRVALIPQKHRALVLVGY